MKTATNIISALVEKHTAELVAFTASRVKDRQVADDLVQETFIAAFKGLENYKGESSHRTWLFSILRNKIIDHYRKYYRGKDKEVSSDAYFDENGSWLPDKAPSSLGDDQHLLDNPEFNATLLNCREHLPKKQFAVLQLKYYDQLEADAICKELEISSTYYWQLIHRAKLQLRDCLQKNWLIE